MTARKRYDISVEEALSSGLIPDADEMLLRPLGDDWFKEEISGVAYHFIRKEDGELDIDGTRHSKNTTKEALKEPPKPKEPVPQIIIKCADCGAERSVKPQDAFQVKRCKICQKAHRDARRRELEKIRRERIKNLREGLRGT